jgi:hypothetical protein
LIAIAMYGVAATPADRIPTVEDLTGALSPITILRGSQLMLPA